jgi:endogenous inhibitor of DNA gyrase (YacG/DUF329 family)
MERPLKIKCPTCKKEGDWFAGAYGPFCSKRCKLVDLGKWFGEENVISSPLPREQAGVSSEPPPDAGAASSN